MILEIFGVRFTSLNSTVTVNLQISSILSTKSSLINTTKRLNSMKTAKD